MNLQSLREVGLYQLIVILVYVLSLWPWYWGDVGILLIAPTNQDFWCHDPAESFGNLTIEERRRIMTFEDRCTRPDLDFENLTTDDFTKLNFSDYKFIKCDGFEFDHSEFDYTATERYQLVCDQSWKIPLLNTVYLCGYLIGSVFGPISDTHGRKLVMVVTSFPCILACVAMALAPNFWLFLVARLIKATFMSAGFSAAMILAFEMVKKDQRMIPTLMQIVSEAFGLVFFGCISMALRSHVELNYLLAALYSIMAFAHLIILKESPRWLVSRGKHEQAQDVVQFIANFNKQNISELDYFLETVETVKQDELKDLLKCPNLLKRTIILCCMWFSIRCVFYALLYNLGDFGPSVRLSIIITGVLDILGMFLIMGTLDYFGRQISALSFMLISTLCCLIMSFFVHDKKSIILMALALLGKQFASNQLSVLYLYTLELYPTTFRNSGHNICNMASRIGSIVSTQIALLNQLWPQSLVITLGVIGLTSVVITPLLPDTTNVELPQRLIDGETFRSDHCYKLTKPSAVIKNDSESGNLVDESSTLKR